MEDEDEEVVYTGVVKKISAKDPSKFIIDSPGAFEVHEMEPRMPEELKPHNVNIGDTIRFTLDVEKLETSWVEKVLKGARKKIEKLEKKAAEAAAAGPVEEEYIGTVTKQSVKNPTLWIVDCQVVTDWYKVEARLPEKLWPDELELGGSIRFKIKETPQGKPLISWCEFEAAAPPPKKKAKKAKEAPAEEAPAEEAPAKKAPAAKAPAAKAPPAKKAKTVEAEVRMDDAESAIAAWELDGSELGGAKISVVHFPGRDNGLTLKVTGIPAGTGWAAVKEYFGQAGKVAFAKVEGDDSKGGGKGGGGGWAEVRFHDSDAAEAALGLYGSVLEGAELRVELDGRSVDGKKVKVYGLAGSVSSKMLKEHFEEIAEVAFCKVFGN